MPAVIDEPPEDPDDWTEDQWRDWLLTAPPDPDLGRAHPMSRAKHGGGAVVAAAMFGLEQAIYGERPKVEIVVEADADGLDVGALDLDLDDPAASHLRLPGDA